MKETRWYCNKEVKVVRYLEDCKKEECFVCGSTENFLRRDMTDAPKENIQSHKKMIPLVKENLRRHLSTGRHYKVTDCHVWEKGVRVQ